MPRPKALSGKTVVVTRPRAQSAPLRRLLEKLGARVVSAPLIKVVRPVSFGPLDAALRRLASYDVVVFTSRNGVEAFFKRLKTMRLAARQPGKAYVVGPSTRKALKEHGWKAEVLAQDHDAEALARHMGDMTGKRILFPRALRAREFHTKGATIDAVTAYRTVADRAGGRRLRLAAPPDAVVFTSPSTVEQFIGQLSASTLRRLFKTGAVASIGPVTARALRRHGFTSIIQAKETSDKGLCLALVRHFK